MPSINPSNFPIWGQYSVISGDKETAVTSYEMEREAVSSKVVNAASDAANIIAERAGCAVSTRERLCRNAALSSRAFYLEHDPGAAVSRYSFSRCLPFMCGLVERATLVLNRKMCRQAVKYREYLALL
jgi:hypothetical protein